MNQPLENHPPANLVPNPELEANEISLGDILNFFQRRWLIIGGTTLAMILVGTAASLVSPSEFRREVLADFEISSRPENEGVSIDESEIEALALFELQTYLKEYRASSDALANFSGSVESASISEANESPTHLRISLKSPVPETLDNFWQSAYQRLQIISNDFAEEQLEAEVERLDVEIARTQNKVAFLKDQVDNASTPAPYVGGNSDIFVFLQFQEQQAALVRELGNLSGLQFQRETLADINSQANPLVEIIILSDIQTQQSTSLTSNLVLSAISGLMLGVLMGFLVDQILRLRKGLEKT